MTDSRTPDSRTGMGVCTWLLRRGEQALRWSGEYDMLRLCPVTAQPDGLRIGPPARAVSGRLTSLADAQMAAGAWLAANDGGGQEDNQNGGPKSGG
jgi:hypothetical protein